MGVATKNSAPPWRVSDLRTVFAGSSVIGPPLSLRTLGNALAARKTTFFVQVRELGIAFAMEQSAQQDAPPVTDADLATVLVRFEWPTNYPSKDTLQLLSDIAKAAGGSIIYVSKDWRTVGITGSTAAFVAAAAIVVNSATELLTAAQHIYPSGEPTAMPLGFIVAVNPPTEQNVQLLVFVKGAS